jgi:hypothetical protein
MLRLVSYGDTRHPNIWHSSTLSPANFSSLGHSSLPAELAAEAVGFPLWVALTHNTQFHLMALDLSLTIESPSARRATQS